MALDLETEVALLEQHGLAVAAQQRIAQAGLEAIPARRQRAREIADVLVVHAEQGAQPMRLHAFAGALETILAHALPVHALLPIQARDAEIRSHFILLLMPRGRPRQREMRS